MATIDEIKKCIDILVKAGTKEEDIILLHCNTEYPTPDCDVNILAIKDLKNNFPKVNVGFQIILLDILRLWARQPWEYV